MASLGCCSSLSLTRTSQLNFSNNHKRIMTCKPLRKRNVEIRAEVNYVSSDEAKELVSAEGYVVLDVRDSSQYDRAHIKSCYHVPLFIEDKDNDPGTIVKRTVHNNFSGLFFGIPFTKRNTEFVKSVRSQFSPDSKLLLVCQEGLRSSAAANELEKAGFENISCITSGLQSVKPGKIPHLYRQTDTSLVHVIIYISVVVDHLSHWQQCFKFYDNRTFESVGSAELQNAGKAGLVTVQGKISAVLGTVLICAYLFITFFPDQAEKILQMVPGS
ncbi:hypothetical protein C5167_008879 [Papaver somniferum]|uniref:Rhodanese domain-containing protein n=1 Tax=Papaver somniferum TaxID=3469 RepID=A0A4Y7JZS0_PAPSO|nr:hypothetical protein C5167_008879 [Papaver somniferum]